MAMKTRYTTINGEVIAEKRNGVRRLYVPDPLGSTVALLDNTQTQVATFTYWPYGEVRTSTGATSTPLQFVGTKGYYSDATGRTYVRARYLHTPKGRWLTQDPISFDGGDWNLYRYAASQPTQVTDPSGKIVATCAQKNSGWDRRCQKDCKAQNKIALCLCFLIWCDPFGGRIWACHCECYSTTPLPCGGIANDICKLECSFKKEGLVRRYEIADTTVCLCTGHVTVTF